MGKKNQQATSFIIMGVVGGAVFPPLMGMVTDHDVAASYYLPVMW